MKVEKRGKKACCFQHESIKILKKGNKSHWRSKTAFTACPNTPVHVKFSEYNEQRGSFLLNLAIHICVFYTFGCNISVASLHYQTDWEKCKSLHFCWIEYLLNGSAGPHTCHRVDRTDMMRVSLSKTTSSLHTKEDFIFGPSITTSRKNHQTDMEI